MYKGPTNFQYVHNSYKKKKKCFSEEKARYLDPRDYGKDRLVYELQNSLTYKISFNLKLSMYKFVMSRKLQGTKTHYFLNEEKKKNKTKQN